MQSSDSQPVPPAKLPAASHTWSLPGHKESVVEPSREAGSSCNSPLFDDFSDGDEFELPERGRKGSHGGEGREDQHGCVPEDVGNGSEGEERGGAREGPRTPPLVEEEGSRLSAPVSPPSPIRPSNEESNLSSISDTSLKSDDEGTPCSPPLDSEPNSPRPPAVPIDTSSSTGTVERESELQKPSEVVAEKPKDVVSEEEPILAAVTPEPRDSSPVIERISQSAASLLQSAQALADAQDSVVTGRTAGVGDRVEPEGIQEVEMAVPSPARSRVEESESTERVEGSSGGQPELAEPLLEKRELGMKEAAAEETRDERLGPGEALSWKRDSLLSEEGGCGSGASSPDARANTSPTLPPSKTPGKRKVRTDPLFSFESLYLIDWCTVELGLIVAKCNVTLALTCAIFFQCSSP